MSIADRSPVWRSRIHKVKRRPGVPSRTSTRRWSPVALILLSATLATRLTAAELAPSAAPLVGFSSDRALTQRQIEARVGESISPARMEASLEWLTSRPHPAGSDGARLTAEYLHRQLESFGLRVETLVYDGYLTAPISVSLRMTEPLVEALPTTEPRIEGDPFTENSELHPGWNGYSASGEAVAHVVYAHFGSEDDLQHLVSRGIDLEGKILLMRNFGTGVGRKIHNAQRFGASGVVLYTDPAEDGYPFGDVYPKGPWRPAGSIMRRSLIFLPYEGDPLSPGWAALPGAERLAPSEVELPRIPVLPVSYGTAQTILAQIRGPAAPEEWQGSLPLTYRLGPGPAKLELRTEMDNRDRPMLDVIAWLEGATDPDEWVVLGTHHDAWIYGAGDPSSGTAAMLELARVLGELAREGTRPRRTLVFGFWDAEEMVLGGSTEWVEQHANELLEKAVACINMDSAVFNPDRPLSVAAHPTLHTLFRDVSEQVSDPRTGDSTYEVWLALQNRYRTVPSVDGWGEFFESDVELSKPLIFSIPYDDAAPFFTYLALPASDMYYGADYGMYHSLYENFHWMKTIADPTFEYHRVMAQIQGLTALRLANADLVPLDYAEEARWWRRAYEQLDTTAKRRGQTVPRIAEALEWIDAWELEAEQWSAISSGRLAAISDTHARPELGPINHRYFQLSRQFHRPEGRPDMTFDRNLFAGWSYEFENVSGSTLPGIRFALDRGDVEAATREADIYIRALMQRVEALRELNRDLGSMVPRTD